MDAQNIENQDRKVRFAIIAIIVGIIFIIITISIVGVFLNNLNTTKIVNESSKNDETVSNEELDLVEEKFSPALERFYNYKDRADVAIRWDTVKNNDLGVEFIADVDEIQQTYRVVIEDGEVFLDCPELGISKYPDSFCIGNYREYNDSISVVFGSMLPINGTTEEGEKFSIARNKNMNSMSDRYLEIYSYSCPSNDETLQRVNKSVDEIISSLGAAPSMFERKIIPPGCHGE